MFFPPDFHLVTRFPPSATHCFDYTKENYPNDTEDLTISAFYLTICAQLTFFFDFAIFDVGKRE